MFKSLVKKREYSIYIYIPYLSELVPVAYLNNRLFEGGGGGGGLFEGGANSKGALIRGRRLLKKEINQYVLPNVYT